MARGTPLFVAQEQTSDSCVTCDFHIKGCCFDPKKVVTGYFAAPCFGCKDILEEVVDE